MENIKKIIGRNINTQLAAQDIRQKDLAKHLGVTDNTISYFCSGNRVPNYEQLLKIADFLGVSTDSLLGRHSEKNENDLILEVRDFTELSVEALKNIRDSAPNALSDLLECDDFPSLIDGLDSLESKVGVCSLEISEVQKAASDKIDFWSGRPTLDAVLDGHISEEEWEARTYYEEFKSDFANMRLEFNDLRDDFSAIIEKITGISKVIEDGKKLLKMGGDMIWQA